MTQIQMVACGSRIKETESVRASVRVKSSHKKNIFFKLLGLTFSTAQIITRIRKLFRAAPLAQHYLNVVATHSCRDRIAARSCRDRNLHPLPRWKRKLLQAELQTGTLVFQGTKRLNTEGGPVPQWLTEAYPTRWTGTQNTNDSDSIDGPTQPEGVT